MWLVIQFCYTPPVVLKVVANSYLCCSIILRDLSTASKSVYFMPNKSINHEYFMEQAYNQAILAYNSGEVPIGAVLVKDGQIISQSYNQTITLTDPTAHAEILVIRAGSLSIKNYRISDSTLYITLEPCIMCLGAIVQARIPELVYACDDSRVGCISRQKYHHNKDINHNLKVTGGIMDSQCKDLLKKFFSSKR